MVRKHNPRDYSKHRYDTIRPYNEFYKVEIFSFDHQYTKAFTAKEGNLKGNNIAKKSWKSWSVYTSKDKKKKYSINCSYLIKEKGEYRIDLLYETAQNTKTTPIGEFNGEEIKLDGILHELKRKTFFKNMEKGQTTFKFTFPKNIYFIGVLVRKVIEFTGDSLDSTGTNLLISNVNTSSSSQISPMEASFKIAYDTSFENILSQSGLYMDYNDEVNIYLKKDGEDKEIRIFGGYLSTILPDSNKTELSVSCAGRMIDGQNNYILSKMRLLGGTKSKNTAETEYTSDMDQDFKTYGAALKFLCRSMEITLKNNIDKNDLVTNEKAKKGFNIEFGKKKKITKISTKNCTATPSKKGNFITLRNDASGTKKQVFVLYNAKNHVTSKPPKITNYTNFGIVYGLGNVKTERTEKTTETVEGTGTGGAQKFNKCGVSQDGKYLMAIGLPSAGKDSVKGFTKTVFKRKCPYCDSTQLHWGFMWSGNFPCSKRYNNGSAGKYEGHVYCDGCDMDFSVQGWEHRNGSRYRLEKVSKIVSSSKSEAYKLSSGEMVAVPSTAVTVTSDAIFQTISEYAFKHFRYKLRGSTFSTASGLVAHGYGDCWAFSEWIFNQLKKYKINCRVIQYATSESPRHRTVQYKNKKNQWVNFPYREYGWGTKYHNMLNDTSGANHPNSVPFKYTAGGTIASASGGGSSSSTQTTTVRITEGYDKEAPLQGYFEVTVSTEPSLKAKTKTVQVGFTQKPGSTNSLTGFTPVWINNTVKQINVDLLDFIKKSVYNDFSNKYDYYLHSIKFVAPVNRVVDSEKSAIEGKTVYKIEDWYTYDKSTKDNSSCKMDLYSINFNNATLINPTDLESCGKSIVGLMEELVSSSKYNVRLEYSRHRKDDTIFFSVDSKSEPSFVAMEGDENNILNMTGISYTPRSNLFNNSTVVFKDESQRYKYIDTRDVNSILQYGEQTTLVTSSEKMGTREAYYNAMNNSNYNPLETFNFSVVLPYFVDVRVGDLVQVISNSKHLNTIKEVKSVKYDCDNNQIPKIQTDLGLGELPVDLQIKKELREIRKSAKKQTTHFSGSAEPILDEEYYEWDN